MIDIDVAPILVTGLSSTSINRIIAARKSVGTSADVVSTQPLGVQANGVPVRRLQLCNVFIRDDSPARVVVFSYLMETSNQYGFVAFMDSEGLGQWSDTGFGLAMKLGGSGAITVDALADGEIHLKVVSPRGWRSLQTLPPG